MTVLKDIVLANVVSREVFHSPDGKRMIVESISDDEDGDMYGLYDHDHLLANGELRPMSMLMSRQGLFEYMVAQDFKYGCSWV